MPRFPRRIFDECQVHLVTEEDEFHAEQQRANFLKIQEAASAQSIAFTWQFDATGSLHARHIVTDTGWKVLLDQELDIFQRYEMNDALNFTNRLQQCRACRACEINYIRT
ncbi:MAG: hypothetical protein IJU37_06625 [Desulfovibrio sp.]|nr:hypothetical protein [Desulfovibrio sp.]